MPQADIYERLRPLTIGALAMNIILPLITLFVFMLGNGFLGTLLALKMNINHQSDLLIGSMTGAFYFGIMLGSFRIERVILKVGHIRAYAGFASVLSVMNMLAGMTSSGFILLLLRFLGGVGTAGVYVVIESWLLCFSTTNNRGQILALYMIGLYLAQALGQFFLNLDAPTSMTLFAICSITSSLSVIPITLAKVQSPIFEEPSTLKFSKLFKVAGSGLVSCFASGVIMGALYGLSPLFFHDVLGSTSQVAFYMFCLILGGMLLQYPVGKLSDVIERRMVLIMLGVGIAFLVLLTHFLYHIYAVFIVLTILIGGLTFTIYPVSISHACDALDSKDVLAGTQSLLLAYSCGAILGPFISPMMMTLLGPWGLYYFYVLVCICLLPILVWRKASKADTEQEDSYLSMPQTSPVLAEIDPRSE